MGEDRVQLIGIQRAQRAGGQDTVGYRPATQ